MSRSLDDRIKMIDKAIRPELLRKKRFDTEKMRLLKEILKEIVKIRKILVKGIE